MNNEMENQTPSVKQKKNDHDTEHEKNVHPPIHAADEKKCQGKKQVAKEYDENPNAYGKELEPVDHQDQ
jgi:hypothetical protein